MITVFRSILILSNLIRIAYGSLGMDDVSELDEKAAELHNELYKTISRIAAEQAAKPEIQGYSEHE